MDFKGIPICCPYCKGELSKLQGNIERIHCKSCRKEFPIILGIPDLRVFPDPYIDFNADIEKGQLIARHFNDFDFEGLIDYYYSITPAVPPKYAQIYKRGLMAGEARAASFLDSFSDKMDYDEVEKRQSLLEIGCGTAPLLATASKEYDRLIGVDIAFRWLVIGKKRLQEANLDIPLICACAEALPFPDSVIADIAAESTIEHVLDQTKTLAECYRVMQPGGSFLLSTPNKFSIGPDPHAGILAGGYLPKSWIASYVKRQGGIPPRRNLLSVGSLRELFQQTEFKLKDVDIPKISKNQLRHYQGAIKFLAKLYETIIKFPLSRQVMLRIGPLLLAIAGKDGN